MSLTRFEEAERAERKAQDAAAKERILRRLRWRPTTLDELAAALTTSQAPAAILTCREVTARRLRDLADDGHIVPDGAAWRLKGDTRTYTEPPPPSPSEPSTRAGAVSEPPTTDPEPTMQGQTPDHRLSTDVTLNLVRQALVLLEPASIRQLTDSLTLGRREGEVVTSSVEYAMQKLLKSGEAEKAGGQGTKFSPRLYRLTQRQPTAKAEPAPEHDVTCYDIEAERAVRESDAVPSGWEEIGPFGESAVVEARLAEGGTRWDWRVTGKPNDAIAPETLVEMTSRELAEALNRTAPPGIVYEVEPVTTDPEPSSWKAVCKAINDAVAAPIPPAAALSIPVIQAALDATGCPSGSDPLHRIEVLGDFAREHAEEAEANGAVLDELCHLLNLDDYRGLPALVKRLVKPVWVSSPLGDLCIVSSTVYVSVPAHAPAGTNRQAEILDDNGRMLARVSIDPAWPAFRWKPLLLDLRAKLVDPLLSDIPF